MIATVLTDEEIKKLAVESRGDTSVGCAHRFARAIESAVVEKLQHTTLLKEVESLRKERDELLAALEKFMDAHEECTDFDGFTAQIVSMDNYHEAQNVAEAMSAPLALMAHQHSDLCRLMSPMLAALEQVADADD